jgi:hypothetical protein
MFPKSQNNYLENMYTVMEYSEDNERKGTRKCTRANQRNTEVAALQNKI